MTLAKGNIFKEGLKNGKIQDFQDILGRLGGSRLTWNIWGHRPEEEQDASAIPIQNSQS